MLKVYVPMGLKVQIGKKFQRTIVDIFYTSVLTGVLGSRKNPRIVTVIYNICVG